MKRFFLLAGIWFAGMLSCTTQPPLQSEKPVPPAPAEPVEQEPAEAPPVFLVLPPAEEAPEPAAFDYSHITEEVHTNTRAEIQRLIGELDGIIEKEDYRAWINNLDASYLERISSKDFLAAQSQSPRLKSQESLKNAEEYFKKVVVPSRAHTDYRIDDIDIQFIPEEEKVLAYLTTPAGRRLRLYELKNVDGTWKIAN
jgi:hypothetical protein